MVFSKKAAIEPPYVIAVPGRLVFYLSFTTQRREYDLLSELIKLIIAIHVNHRFASINGNFQDLHLDLHKP